MYRSRSTSEVKSTQSLKLISWMFSSWNAWDQGFIYIYTYLTLWWDIKSINQSINIITLWINKSSLKHMLPIQIILSEQKGEYSIWMNFKQENFRFHANFSLSVLLQVYERDVTIKKWNTGRMQGEIYSFITPYSCL